MADETNSHTSPQTGLRLGFGASGAWSKRWFSEAKAHKLVVRALDKGIRHFDTASFYADGLAEIRLGNALANIKSETVEISTKTGTHYHATKPATKDFSDANIRKDVEQSLARLRRERLDILYLHGPDYVQLDAARETIGALKREGKIRLAGVCGAPTNLEHTIKDKQIDIIMGPYNVLDQSCRAEFKKAKAAGMRTVGIATLVPHLGSKNLTRPKSFSDIWYLLRAAKHNHPSMPNLRERLHELAQRHGHPSTEHLMISYALTEPNLDIILTNTTRLPHLDANIEAAKAPPLSPDLLAELKTLVETI